ncbi:hypothetical protein DFH11DRAFT_1858205 [Phellopilus nigrolimitatus]|nr:hypothetical protein DFH11DRAFT_1858205 [Phellopilus nigrolimitatus]
MHLIRSDVESVDPSLVPLLISELNISLYIEVTILTLLVYDMLITTDKEIKYFWSSPRSFVSLIYFANRYIGILGALSVSELCTERHLAHCREDLMTVLLIDYILLIRVLALYHQDKRLAACLRSLFGLEAAFTLGILVYGTIYEESKHIFVVGKLSEDITLCGYNRSPPKVWGALPCWNRVAAMLYGIILMILALYKAAEHWRETAGFSQFTLVKVLIQDQAIYFIMVIFCSVMQIISFQLYIPNVLLADLLTILGNPSLLCVLGSHMLVHLKEAGERGANGGTSYRLKTMSNIEFT